jgi:FlaA1/EpsC-like NDP-sugar epimerase
MARFIADHLPLVDGIGMLVAAYLAFSMSQDTLVGVALILPFAPIFVLLIAVRYAWNLRLGLYHRGWRFASVVDLQRILASGLLGTLVAVVAVYAAVFLTDATRLGTFHWSFWPIEMLCSIAVLGGVRFAVRVAWDWQPSASPTSIRDSRPTLLYGAGRTGVQMARSIQRRPEAGLVTLGFLDDDPNLVGRLVEGLTVFGGLESLRHAAAATGATNLLITMPSAHGTAIRRVVDAAMTLGLDVRTVPSVTDLLDGTLDAYRVRRVQVEDLLRRPTGGELAPAVSEIIKDHTVVITGAGGSIGSELARQVFAVGPRRLVLVDRAETTLYLVQRELEFRRAHGKGGGELRAHLANVASYAAMDRLIAMESPDVIFHAAAYKHVPMMEEHPTDAVHVNIGGTLALLEAAVANGVSRFVLVSTDKAVAPSSIMGASKRVAEMLVADAASRTGKPYVSVRFGNVLGSSGSVVPIFQEQLEKGEPITITHPDMTRYFMTIPEAASLILDAAALGAEGETFVLDMGEPIRIIDLARDLVRLAGRDPDAQPMEIVGLRPGEKLHETLFYASEEVEQTAVAKILKTRAGPPPAAIRTDARALLRLATGTEDETLRSALMAYVDASGTPESSTVAADTGATFDQQAPAPQGRVGAPAS